MVTELWVTWECPVCKRRYSACIMPARASVWCEGPDHNRQMVKVEERWL